MAVYTLEVTTGSMLHAGTFDNLYVTLIGTESQSRRTQLSFGLDNKTAKVGKCSVTTIFSLGCLLLLKLEKDPFLESLEKDWFCSKIMVRTPEEDEILFPCHRWLSRGGFVLLRGGRATKAFEDLHPRLVEQRKKELVQQKLMFKWDKYADGMSYNLNLYDPTAVPAEISLSFSKVFQFRYMQQAASAELKLKGVTNSTEQWESFEAMKGFSWFKKSPLSEEMMKPFLANGSSLTAEMKLGQQPSEENPIFLPSDLESDWLLAKIFVRHVDALYAQLVTHLQKTHLLAEVFTMATLRNLPIIHPLYKLLIPHHRNTLYTNIVARVTLYGPGRTLGNSSLGGDGFTELMRRSLSQTTYTSLCLPENIAARGLESIPNFYYRDDALRLWSITNSFVKAMVAYYYPSDSEVSADSELQEWVNEIFYYGFLGNGDSGIPSNFQTVEELIKFVTMVIFTSSAQHSAVNSAQFDLIGWIPNGPLLLHQAPPTTKGQSSTEAILATLPNKYSAGLFMSFVWLISRKYDDFVPLGTYPEQRFESAALQMIKDFQAELSSLSVVITKRNSELELPYDYLNPKEIDNSVNI
ncbi:hydroperoxide isomerase ALOXE3-like isoform X6 [Siniperca chuatsi]|uniref:hydroperoxide isomerase ALOXE3-like isoform X6 n=1 Tax=Siniperca chuatsi TaxID=119488 RepID=UPI001CE1AF13|nr:hydroperoxide isomerase ALOXE3-like isoform X6 [Siniperca chuatsi]